MKSITIKQNIKEPNKTMHLSFFQNTFKLESN